MKPNSLTIADNSAKGEISKELMQQAWNRLFWTRRFAYTVEFGLPQSVQDESWRKYDDAVERWNTNVMVNIVMLEKYYSAAKSSEFENSVQHEFLVTNECVLRLRYLDAYSGKHSPACSGFSDTVSVAAETEKRISALNRSIYCFAREFSPTGSACK